MTEEWHEGAKIEDLPLPFQGEEVTCFRCGRSEVSDPRVESGWYSFSLEGDRGTMRLYWCGRCIP